MILPLGSLGYVRKLRPLTPFFFFFFLQTMYSVAFPAVLPGMEELNTACHSYMLCINASSSLERLCKYQKCSDDFVICILLCYCLPCNLGNDHELCQMTSCPDWNFQIIGPVTLVKKNP